MTNGVGCDINGSTNAVGGNGNQKINGGRCLVPYANGVRFQNPGSRPRRAPWVPSPFVASTPTGLYNDVENRFCVESFRLFVNEYQGDPTKNTQTVPATFLTPLGLSRSLRSMQSNKVNKVQPSQWHRLHKVPISPAPPNVANSGCGTYRPTPQKMASNPFSHNSAGNTYLRQQMQYHHHAVAQPTETLRPSKTQARATQELA